MPELPDGVVTFAFTDVEGSTRLWEDDPEAMEEAMSVLDELVESTVRESGGFVVKPRGEGDSHFLVFNKAADAVSGIARLQHKLATTVWPTPRRLTVRAALHTGSAGVTAGDYYGAAVNRTARLRAIAHGGQTIISRATWELVADAHPEGIEFVDMGEHLLKDLTRPEQVFQVNAAGLPVEFPPLTSLRGVPNNLPEQLTEFIGRQSELADAVALLVDTRLLTILAPGGSGKTRLAVQAAADVADDFKDGVFFIGLSEIASSGDIIQTVAEALGLGLSADEELHVQLLNYLSNKQQLLVFDNFEHVTDGTGIVSSILKRAPQVKVIATSRAKLNLSGETVMSIGGLDTMWESSEAAYQTSGVRLFVDAATRLSPSFQLRDEDLGALGKILKLVDGMPLAILLAATWVDVLSVSEIGDEISKSVDILETEMGDIPDRHRSVRAVFDYSWALLDDHQKDVFSLLSVFRGGFTRDAAQEISGAGLRDLAALAGKSLVTANTDTGRYSIHELLRQFAEAELQSDVDTWEQTLDRHAEFFSNVVDAATKLLTSSDQILMASTIEADLENIRSAWRRTLKTGRGEAGLKILRGLYFLYEWRGWFPSAVALFGEALESLDPRSEDESCVQLRAMSLAVQGWFRSLIGQAEVGSAAATEAEAALPDATGLFDRWIAWQCSALGYGYTGAVEPLIRTTNMGIDLATTMEDELYAAGMKNWRSLAAVLGEDPSIASRLLSEAMEVFEERDEHHFMTWALWIQALVALGEDRPIDAIGLFNRQVTRAEDLGYLRGRVVGLEGLGDANTAAGRHADARFAYVRSLATADQMGMVADILGLMTKIGGVLALEGRNPEAVRMLSAVLKEPLSNQKTFNFTSPIRDTTQATLTELEAEMEEEAFLIASRDGEGSNWETVAKELMDSIAKP